MGTSRRNIGDVVSFGLFVVSVLFFIYMFGCFSARWSWWPYPMIDKAVLAAKAWSEKLKPVSPYNSTFYDNANHETGGVVTCDADRAYNGVTLFSYGLDQKAVLIGMDGRILHQWHIPFSSVWKDPPHIQSPVEDQLINATVLWLYPNGDILAVYATDRDTPFGYGLVKADKDSRVIWKYAARAHHDLDVAENGDVYVLTHEIRTKDIPGAKVKQPFLDDYVVVLSSDGKLISKFSITDAFLTSNYKGILESIRGWDVWHTNNIEVLGPDIAPSFAFLKEGCVLVSMKSVRVLAAIDIAEKKVIWALRGSWEGQHDPDFLPNGRMLLFDNQGHCGEGGRSRVLEFNPLSLEIIWEYTGDRTHPFFSAIRSSQQRLPNGNTLITESDNGRIFEVTKEGKIAWDYRTVYRAPQNPRRVAVMLKAQRYERKHLVFPFNGGVDK